jgi:hypothetical protein
MIEDRVTARGAIDARWVSEEESIPFFKNHNALSYTAADVMASAYGGDIGRIPKYVGFLYGDEQQPPLLPEVIDRYMTWDSLKALTEDIEGNLLVVRFSRKPTITTSFEDSNDLGLYDGNIVEFHAVTRSGEDGVYANDTSGESKFAGKFESGKWLYRAVLLGDPKDCEPGYTVLGMASLKKNGAYRAKPSEYELALDWRIVFN